MAVLEVLVEAARSGGKVRVHTEDEVAVVQVLRVEAERVVYRPIHSSRPERYAVCDSPGFELPLAAVLRVVAVRER